MTTGPARTYYEACVGQWRSPVAITITDSAALATSGASWLDRQSLRLLARWPAWLGRVFLDTEVAFRAADEVVHTTIVRWMGVPLQRSVEVYKLDADGARLSITGGMTGSGSINAAATQAVYQLAWLGMQIQQSTARDGDTVKVDQRGPGFHGVQMLVRLA
jgi:hypothetical protein